MRVASVWYFAVRDTAAYLRRNKRAALLALLLILTGIIIGISASAGHTPENYMSYLNMMLSGAYSPFGEFFKIALFSLICVILTYLYMIGRWARIIPYIIVFYCGFVIGRAALLNIMLFKLAGLVSFFLFLFPCYLALLAALFVFVNHLRKTAFCGIHSLFFARNLRQLAVGMRYFACCLLAQFLIIVVLGGILQTIIKL